MSTNATPRHQDTDTYRAYLDASQRCAEAFGTRPAYGTWTHPGTGQRRRYINNIPQIIGFDAIRYGTTRVSATLRGETLSNRQSWKVQQLIETAKFWVDDNDRLHYRNADAARDLDVEDIADAINATLTK